MTSRVRQVMKQTRARIFRGNRRSPGKLLSLFEPAMPRHSHKALRASLPLMLDALASHEKPSRLIQPSRQESARQPLSAD
jgi:hypothetical protein